MSAPAFVPPATLDGEAMLVPVAAGSTLHVVAGRLRVEAPGRWLGERVVTMPRLLRPGETHVMLRSGLLWLEPQGRVLLQWRLAAASPAPVGLLTQASAWARRVWAALRPARLLAR